MIDPLLDYDGHRPESYQRPHLWFDHVWFVIALIAALGSIVAVLILGKTIL